MQVRVLGAIEIVDDEGRRVALGGPMPARVLALLVANRPALVSNADLIAQLWGGGDMPRDPQASLRTLLALVGSTLGPDSVVTGTSGYALGNIDTDADRFEDLIERARRASESPMAGRLCGEALDLWRGPAYGDLADLASVHPEAARLDELRAEATEVWIAGRLTAGEGRELAADVDNAVTAFPLHEVERQIIESETPQSVERQALRGYELGERLGEGAFAVVYRAHQTSVGRTVAIKQIRGSLADQPEFIRQFEAEAHLIARLEHPHIVPLYDYWREPGSAYLVMRYVGGGSLSGRLADGPVALAEAVATIAHVAAGLDVAHRSGVIHRDVKPANILLDSSGNAYLSDFGIAVEEAERLDPQAWLSRGSPAYAPPEQLGRREVGPTADVYALGVTTYESLTGQLPFPAETTMAGIVERQLNDPVPLVRSTHPELPAAIDTVIQRATAKSPADRYTSAGAFARELERAAGMDGNAELIEPDDRNPYKGLRAFDEADAADFAGRDRLVRRLLDAAKDSSAVLVVGPSGSGKSSAVRAGLLPALRQGRLPGSERWFMTTMIPGPAPFADLEAALLRVAVDPPLDMRGSLESGPTGLARVLRRVVPENCELLLVIDQFEELFTHAPRPDRTRFLDSLLTAMTNEHARLRVVATIRADFYDQPLRHPAFATAVETSTVAVHPLAPDELERAIIEPATSVGATFEPGLVAQITADVADQPGSLPLLQYALTELFDGREGQILTRTAYDRLGGVAGALTRRADEVYSQAPTEHRSAIRSMMTRLVTPGEGTEDTRRRALRSELGADASTSDILKRFDETRLVSFDRDPATREQTVEVAHEALIREWPRLREWLAEDRDGLRVLRHLTEAAEEWQSRGRPSGELYRAGRLEAAEEWAEQNANQLNEVETAFLAKSREQRFAAEQRERDRLAEQVQSNRRLRRRLTGTVLALALALFAGGLALDQRSTARATAFESDVRRMVSTSSLIAEENPQLAMLIAAEARNRSDDVNTLGALQRTLTRTDGLLGYLQSGASYRDVAASTLGFVVAATDEGLEVWNIESRSIAHKTEIENAGKVAVSGTGALAIVTSAGGVLTIIDLVDGKVVARVDVGADIGDVAASRSERALFAAGLEDGSIITIDPTGATARLAERPTGIQAVDFGPDDATIITYEGFALVRAIDANGGEMVWESTAAERGFARTGIEPAAVVDEFGGGVISLALSADGTEVRAFSSVGFVLDAATGEFVPEPPRGYPFAGDGVDLGDGRLFVGGLTIDADSGEVVDIAAQVASRGRVAYERHRRIAVLATPSRISLWSMRGDQLLARAVPREGGTFVSFEPGGNRLASTNWPNAIFQFWDVETGVRVATDFGADTFAAGWGPSGDLYTWHTSTKETRVWDGSSFELRSTVPGQNWAAFGTTYDGGHAVVGSADLLGGFRVYDLRDGGLVVERLEMTTELERRGVAYVNRALPQISFSPNGELFAIVAGGLAALYETGDWSFRDLVDLDENILSVGWSPDSGTTVVQTADSQVHFIDPTTLAQQRPSILARNARASTVGNQNLIFGPNDTLLVGHASGVELWDLASSQQIGGVFPNEPDTLFSGTPVFDGTAAVTATDEHLLIWNLDTDEWVDLACRAAGRNMTRAEWQEFGPVNTDYQTTCPQWPDA